MAVKFSPIAFVAVLLVMAINGHSQNWQPINKDKVYYYQADTADHLTHQLQVDSVRTGDDSKVHFLNLKLDECDTCGGGILTRLTGDTAFYRVDYPFFWQRQMADSSADDLHYFFGFEDFALAPHKALDSSWQFRLFSDVTAQIDSVYEAKLFGTTDSVKRMVTANKDTFEVSKNHGIITFPNLNNDVSYHLKGIRDSVLSGKGFGFRAVYDFNTGDAFQYEITDSSEEDNLYLGATMQIHILEKTVTAEGFSYKAAIGTLEKTRISNTDTVKGLNWDTTTLTFTRGGKLPYDIKNFPDIHDQSEAYPNQALLESNIKDKNPIPGENTIFRLGCLLSVDSQGRVAKTIGGEPPINDRPYYPRQLESDPFEVSVGFFTAATYIGGYYKKAFKEGLGLTHFYVQYKLRESFRLDMTGYVKGDDTFGTFYANLEDRERMLKRSAPSGISNIRLYPNPVQHTLHITNLSPAQTAEIRLYNQMGQLVSRHRQKGEKAHLTLEGLEPGLYILRIKDGQKLIQRKVLKR